MAEVDTAELLAWVHQRACIANAHDPLCSAIRALVAEHEKLLLHLEQVRKFSTAARSLGIDGDTPAFTAAVSRLVTAVFDLLAATDGMT